MTSREESVAALFGDSIRSLRTKSIGMETSGMQYELKNAHGLGEALPDTTAQPRTTNHVPWNVILFNDEEHTFEEVIRQLVFALPCDQTLAYELTSRVHHEGKATVFEGAFEDAMRVQTVLQEIGLVTEIKG